MRQTDPRSGPRAAGWPTSIEFAPDRDRFEHRAEEMNDQPSDFDEGRGGGGRPESPTERGPLDRLLGVIKRVGLKGLGCCSDGGPA
ncbi:MAG: hypothetical protein ACOYO7_10480, partial [Phycisphaerales bacterium]